MIDKADSKLVGDTVERILALHGDNLNVLDIPRPHQIVLLVNQAHARITNGGFQFLLERHDADYELCKLMSDAHAAVGADTGYRAFSEFLRGFLGIKPTAVIARPFNRFRLTFSLVKAMIGFETADTLYFESSDETFSRLAAYITSNSHAFPSS